MAGLPDSTFARLLEIIRSDEPFEVPVGELTAVVDMADADLVSPHHWQLHSGYAVASIDGRRVPMHTLILGRRDGVVVDHKDRDKLNNRRSNLRHCSPAQNSRNRGSTKKYKGVQRNYCRWEAAITIDGKRHYLGKFDSQRAAAKAYDAAALRLHRDFACTNEMLGKL